MKLSASPFHGEVPTPRHSRSATCLVLLAGLVVSGCEYLAPPHQDWTEARVVGRVVDGDTHQPVAGAHVTRARTAEPGGAEFRNDDKGGPRMADRPVVATSDREGNFTLQAVKNAYLLLDSFPDYAVTLRIQTPGYQTFQTLFTNVTYVGGDKKTVPIIETGEILLRKATDGK
jgi:hypothetical protein